MCWFQPSNSDPREWRLSGEQATVRRQGSGLRATKQVLFYIYKEIQFSILVHSNSPPPACGGRVKPPPTGSGSSVHASSGRCWGSSFGGLLTSRRPSGYLCQDRQQQMLSVHQLFKKKKKKNSLAGAQWCAHTHTPQSWSKFKWRTGEHSPVIVLGHIFLTLMYTFKIYWCTFILQLVQFLCNSVKCCCKNIYKYGRNGQKDVFCFNHDYFL